MNYIGEIAEKARFRAEQEQLEAMLDELETRLAHIGEDLAEPLNADSSEQAVEMEDDAALQGQGALITREIASVKRALERIENGTYAICVNCGNPINPRRLAVRPEAALCITCASQESI